MDARYTIRKHQLLDECQVAPEIFEQVIRPRSPRRPLGLDESPENQRLDPAKG